MFTMPEGNPVSKMTILPMICINCAAQLVRWKQREQQDE